MGPIFKYHMKKKIYQNDRFAIYLYFGLNFRVPLRGAFLEFRRILGTVGLPLLAGAIRRVEKVKKWGGAYEYRH